eukprot:7109-Heterococcus_DN1.PRE.1
MHSVEGLAEAVIDFTQGMPTAAHLHHVVCAVQETHDSFLPLKAVQALHAAANVDAVSEREVIHAVSFVRSAAGGLRTSSPAVNRHLLTV